MPWTNSYAEAGWLPLTLFSSLHADMKRTCLVWRPYWGSVEVEADVGGGADGGVGITTRTSWPERPTLSDQNAGGARSGRA
jgi:hypothetical protein